MFLKFLLPLKILPFEKIISLTDQAKKKDLCGSGYPTNPTFLPPTLNFCSPNSEVGILLCYSLQTLEFGEKIHIKMTI